jgi:prophage regulatory protein
MVERRRKIRLAGSYEVGMMLGGVSRQRVNQVTAKATFPTPVAELKRGKVWLTADVEEWIAVYRSQDLGARLRGDVLD